MNSPCYTNKNNYVESARVYLKQDATCTIVIKCCLCSAGAFTGAGWEAFMTHLRRQHTAAIEFDGDDSEIQDEVELEMANLKDAQDNSASESEEEHVQVFTNVEFLDESDENELCRGSEREEESESSQANYVLNTPQKPFYSLLRTSPEIIHYFIDLLEQHTHLWQSHKGLFRKERLESAQRVSDAMAQRFGFSLLPQVVCTSSRSLSAWFERQFASKVRSQSWYCRYPAYYDRLVQFMPTNHITVIVCDECRRSFLNEYQLEVHKYRVHSGQNPNVCSVCNKGFGCASKLLEHRARYHFKPVEWQCKLCSYNAPSKWEYQQHLTVHSGQRNYTCEVCGQSYKSTSALAVHRRTHSQPRLACPHCQKHFRENSILKKHIKRVHKRENSRNYACRVCWRRFQTVEVLKLHEQTHVNFQHNELDADADDPEIVSDIE
ncbi:zinc finger and BTB domain-containing protein 41 isoform X2 [Drosophila subobscura]|uniref:zinc finger and BTB domain-containing protein 41 isoform X2 n=1 Tax=Drosophila subobscura TaxID=7241 RepID=UPI00155A5DB9|nr:zinc finger and BTB domain-containing protein 41 isoform X2 [Drosophila subobscura]